MESKKYSLEIGGKELKVEIGGLAGRANSSVLAQMGDTVVLATCVMAKNTKEGVNYLPLSVDYEERLYAAGKIKGSRFIKREGRPSDEAILTGRLIDRSIRPLFDQRIRNSIQIVITVLSFDGKNDPDTLSLIAASLSLTISDIPWAGPVGCIRVSRVENSLVFNPDYQERETSEFNVLVAGTENRVNMLEARSQEASEEKVLEGIEAAQPHIKKSIDWQKKIQKEIGKEKISLNFPEANQKLISLAKEFLQKKLEEVVYNQDQVHLGGRLDSLKEELLKHLEKAGELGIEKDHLAKEIEEILEKEIDNLLHKNVLESEKRPDGRKLDEVRPLNCQVALLPRTHGSGLFLRGATQALAIVTLGSPGMVQLLDTMEYDKEKHFILHYNFPPFCVGETGFLRGPGRREIGHGALAEKAVESLIPEKDGFPYTIRVVSEILSSNGSSSMASVSATSLALMDAGVPMKGPAAGIALGLVLGKDINEYKILTDIQGPEDHHGDMDLKIAGTKNGITAMQMDVKVEGLTVNILKDAFARAKKARLEILAEMEKAIAEPRKELSQYAPVIITLQINPDKIRDVIGPGGKVINRIIAETGVDIDIEDSGLVFITSPNKEANEKAVAWIQNLTHEVQPGEVFQGRVTRILNFGAMVEILPGQEGLIHISELAPYHVQKVSDIVKIGDLVPVKVKNIDDMGRINLTMNNAKK